MHTIVEKWHRDFYVCTSVPLYVCSYVCLLSICLSASLVTLDILCKKCIHTSEDCIQCFTNQLSGKLANYCGKMANRFLVKASQQIYIYCWKMDTEFFRHFSLLHSPIIWKSCKILWENGIPRAYQQIDIFWKNA